MQGFLSHGAAFVHFRCCAACYKLVISMFNERQFIATYRIFTACMSSFLLLKFKNFLCKCVV
ncbi:hypothetical protein HMPREF3190_00002 [Umbribacter vaginalis]|nr:hypothetical protein HMPREF3190_00002 [Coriobacteriales bacterium DNF00809]